MSKSRMLIPMILIILLFGSISIAYISYINDNVAYIDVNEFGIVINDDSGLILVSNNEFRTIMKDFINRYHFIKDPNVKCTRLQDFYDDTIIHSEIGELQSNISRAIRRELNISSFVVVASLMRDCTGYPCPVHVLVYVNEADHRSGLESLISNIVNMAYRNTTYYKKGYCIDNPVTTLFIIPSNPELFNEVYTTDCYRKCSELIYSDIQNLLLNKTSNITLGLNGCYLVSHSVSASPLPHHAIGLYCKDYANKTITMDLLREFVVQHRDSIINITRLVKEKCCIGKNTLFIIILENKPFRKVVAMPEHVEDVDELLNETSTSNQGATISIEENNSLNKEVYNESLCTKNGLAKSENNASETLHDYKNELYNIITLLALALVMTCSIYLLIKHIRTHG
ncbi:MAG: hypothetical protein DRO40_05430 [Thermoprotei archaeon]|nr:MAG: hypothetical protein DRO40_05430 [Thermoprotei archaeon]